MKQSDVLSIAINGIQRELNEAEQEVTRLERVLYDLQALDREDQAVRMKDNIGRPAGFTPEPLINHDRK